MLLAFLTSSLLEPSEPRNQVYLSIPSPQGHPCPFSILLSTWPSAHSFIHKYLGGEGMSGKAPGWALQAGQASGRHTALCMCKLTHTLHRLTFSSSCLSCFVRASREHMVCWGATTVQIHLPSLSWAELYTCQLSSGLVGNTWRGAGREGHEERKRM